MNSVVKTVIFWLVIVISATLLWQVVRTGGNRAASQEPEISYSGFLAQVESGQVSRVSIVGNVVHGTKKNGDLFRVTAPADHAEMMSALKQHEVEIWFRDQSTQSWPAYLLNLAPLILLAGIWFFMIRQMRRRSAASPEIPVPITPPSSSPRFGP
jgi:cell division protease FtsH